MTQANYIDAHVHVWAPPTDTFPLAEGYTVSDMKPPSFTPDEFLAHAQPCGVNRIVLIQMTWYGFDNSYMLATMKNYPGVFSGTATIDDSVGDPRDKMQRLKKHGVRSFRLVTHDRDAGAWFATEGIQSMWKAGAEEGLSISMLSDPEVLPAIDGMCEQFPDTTVVIDHLARIGVGGVIKDEDVATLCNLSKRPNTYVKVSAFYALGQATPPYTDMAPMLKQVYEAYGPERLMWASDCPFQVDPGHTYQDSIDLVKDHLDFLSEEDKGWVLGGTAESLFF